MTIFQLSKEIFRRYPFFFGILLFFAVIGTLLEAAGLSMVFPVFASLLEGAVPIGGKIEKFFEFLRISQLTPNQLLLLLSSIFVCKGLIVFFIHVFSQKISITIEVDI